jgi:hypothetical protein
LAQTNHVRLNGLGRARRRIVAPHRVDESVDADVTTRSTGEQRKKSASLPACDVQRLSVELDLHRSE